MPASTGSSSGGFWMSGHSCGCSGPEWCDLLESVRITLPFGATISIATSPEGLAAK